MGSNPLISRLKDYLSRFETSRDVIDKLGLAKCVIEIVPFYRQGFGLSRSSNILWLIGRSTSSNTNNRCYFYALSPSVSPCVDWQIVSSSVIEIKMSRSTSSKVNVNVIVGSEKRNDDELLMRCLNHLLPDDSRPKDINVWESFISLSDDSLVIDKDVLLKEMTRKECNLFIPDRNLFGVEVYYWCDLLKTQRGGGSEEQLKLIMLMMTKNHEESKLLLTQNHEELKSNQEIMIGQLNRVEGILAQLTEQLSGVLNDIRDELMKTQLNGDELKELKNLWVTRMDGLESVIQSSSGQIDAKITKELKGLELKLVRKIHDLEINVDPARVVDELNRLRDELIKTNHSRLEGDATADAKLNDILREMRGLQSHLDRLEEKMDQYFLNLNVSMKNIHEELVEKGKSEDLNVLRELWVNKMSELETICRSTSAVTEASLDKHFKKLNATLDETLFDLDLDLESISTLGPQLNEIKQQLQTVVTGVHQGDETSQKRFESMMMELKELQTQFVEVISLQKELSVNLNEGLSSLKNCIVNINTRICPTTFILIPTPPHNTEHDRKGMIGHVKGLYNAIRSPKETIISMLQDKYHVALVCEVCRCPDEDKSLWYEVREPREVVSKILPLAQAGLEFASVLNRVSSIGRIFGLPTPVLNDDSFRSGREFLNDLEKSSFSDYKELERLTQDRERGNISQDISISMGDMEMGYCIREFSRFLSENDPEHIWSHFSPRVNEKGDLCYVCRSCLQGKKVDR